MDPRACQRVSDPQCERGFTSYHLAGVSPVLQVSAYRIKGAHESLEADMGVMVAGIALGRLERVGLHQPGTEVVQQALNLTSMSTVRETV